MSSIEAVAEGRQSSTEAPDAAGLYRIWPGDGVPPGSESWDWHERTMQAPWTETPRRMTRNVVIPTLTVFRPRPEIANGTSLIVAPGGAFHFLLVDHEGYDMARWLTERGITAFVLKYRLARTPDADGDVLEFRNNLHKRLKPPAPGEPLPPGSELLREARLYGEEDGRQAVRFVRERATEWNLDPQRIGIAGFSAGGGVALGAVLQNDAASRPDFAAGVYPAYRAELPVPADIPPLFLVISDDDKSVAPVSSARLYEAWNKAGQSAELHVFANGGHGYGVAKEGILPDVWLDLFGNWLRARGLLDRPR